MAAFLGIYSKHKTAVHPRLTEIIGDFSLQNTRSLVHYQFPGMQFCVADKFNRYYAASAEGFSFVSGHFSSANGKNSVSANSMADTFYRNYTVLKEKCLIEAEGAFALVNYNQKQHCLFLANDKFGSFPLFISEDADFIIFSNEYQPLIHFNEKKINHEAVAEFFTLGTCLGSKTFFTHINNLEPASFLRAEKGQSYTTAYYSFKKQQLTQKTDPEIAKELYSCFKVINQEYVEAGHFDLCLLSAGADSRLITATLSQKQREALTFFTSNLSFLNEDEDMDASGARMLSEKFGLKHRVEKISFFENQFNSGFFEQERKLRVSHVYGGWHGGELLGGFCLHAAPINQLLNAKEVLSKYKTIFSWIFRLKTKSNPYKNYLKELKKYERDNGNLHFMIHQLIRGFFTNIYGGTRGFWAQPHQLTNHGFSPFWDSRFLQKLLEIEEEKLKNYALYNEVFKHCEKEFTQVPSNSPLTRRPDSAIPPMKSGIDPKGKVPNTHNATYLKKLTAPATNNKGYYNKNFRKILSEEQHPLTRQWLDFEVWMEKYGS